MKVVRAMKWDEDWLPKTGASARTLGARANIDIPVNEDGFVEPRTDGMSVSPSLVLPCGTEPLTLRGGHRARERLPALGRIDSNRFRGRVHVRRRGGGLRGLRPIDQQTGRLRSLGRVGVRLGRVDVALRWSSSAHRSPRVAPPDVVDTASGQSSLLGPLSGDGS